jgi:hypothetical protein
MRHYRIRNFNKDEKERKDALEKKIRIWHHGGHGGKGLFIRRDCDEAEG